MDPDKAILIVPKDIVVKLLPNRKITKWDLYLWPSQQYFRCIEHRDQQALFIWDNDLKRERIECEKPLWCMKCYPEFLEVYKKFFEANPELALEI